MQRWSESDVAILRKLHTEGLIDLGIADRMGRTKGMVVSKRIQLGLPSQQELKWGRRAPVESSRGAAEVAKAKVRSAPSKPAAAADRPAADKGDHRAEAVRPKHTLPLLSAAPVSIPIPATPQPTHACQFPLWPHHMTHREAQRGGLKLWCGAAVVPGRPYCAEHCAKAARTTMAA